MRSRWRSSCNETPELKTTYDSLREKYGFRVSNYSGRLRRGLAARLLPVHRALAQAHRFLALRRVRGEDKPALSVDDQQICVEGLKHGESYAIALREGLPSTVGEDLLKTADFSIYVRDRSPFVRLSGKAYVLPKTGQQGIPARQRQHRRDQGDDLPDRRPQSDRLRCSAATSSATSTAIR